MIRRIFIDNLQDLSRIGGTVNLRFSKGCHKMDEVWEESGIGLSNFLDIFLNTVVKHYESRGEVLKSINKEDGISIAIETDKIIYTKILAPDGITTVLEETVFKDSGKTLRRELGDELNFVPHLKFCNEVYGNAFDQPLYILGKDKCRFIPQESPEVVEFCNKIVPIVFPEIFKINSSGGAIHRLPNGKEITFSREVEGGGYNQLLNVLKGLYIATTTDSIIVFRYWRNHFHPILANAMLEVFKDLEKKDKIKGSIILEEP